MSPKYLIIAVILITLSLDVSGQSRQTINSNFFHPEARLNLINKEVRKISFSGLSLYTGLTPPSNLRLRYHNNINSEIYYEEKLPTLNELKSSMLDNIELPADFSSRLRFDLEDNDEQDEEEESESFFSSSLFYFLGAAVLATTFYILWQDDQNETATRTFGYPPRPETDP